MISKTQMVELIKDLRSKEVAAGLAEKPALLAVRDKRGRNWLHLCCGVNPKTRKLKPIDGVKTAQVLLHAGLDLNLEAFREGIGRRRRSGTRLRAARTYRLRSFCSNVARTPTIASGPPPAARVLQRSSSWWRTAQRSTPWRRAILHF